jgi:Na+/melibiose symporter-like transporter
LKKGVGIGIILTAVGGLIRAVGGRNYGVCLTGQIIAAIGQPFVLNSFTKLSANWFLESEKTTAAGIGSISLFIGVIIAMLLPDILGPSSIELMLWIYAILGLIIMVLFLVFAKDKPESPPNKYADKEMFAKTPGGMKELFKNKDFTILSIMVFIGLGIFNAITAVIDLIFTDTAYPGIVSGNVSAYMIFGGILGAVIISAISDKIHKRKIFLIIAFVTGIFLSLLLGIIQDPILIYIISFIFGFVLVSCLPIGTTYGAEITYPIPEEQSNGILMTAGQISGIIFLVFPSELFLFISAGMFAIGAVLSFLIHDTDWYESKRAGS